MKKLILLLFIIFITNYLFAQNKKPLDFKAYDYWETLEHQKISDNGQWVCYETVPYKGNLTLNVINPITNKTYKVKRAKNASFSPSSKFIAFKVKPEYKKIRDLKLKKTNKNKFPKDSLGIILLNSGKIIKFKELVSFILPKEKSEWIAYLQFKKNNSKTKKKIKNLPKTYNLKVFNPVNYKLHEFKNVSEMSFSENGKLLGFIQFNNSSILESTVKIINTETGEITKIFNKKGLAKKISLDNSGNNAAFIFSSDTDKIENFSLNLWQYGNTEAKKIVVSKNPMEIPKDWGISQFGEIWFSKNNTKLYFGTALKEKKAPKDTLLNEEKVNVDIWSWTDPLLQSQQLANLKKDKKKNYLTVYNLNTKKTTRLEDELVDNVKTILNGNGDIALGIATKPFLKESTWKFPAYKDIYLIDVKTGNKKLIIRKAHGEIDISTFGNYIFWYNSSNKNWYTYNIKTKETKSLTENLNIDFSNFTHDYPYPAPSYSFVGWTKDDKYFLVYDKYDIWKLDPNGIETPVNFTDNYGKRNNIKLRYLNLDKEIEYIDIQNTILLSGFNYKNKQSGYFQKNIYRRAPFKLTMDNYRFYNIIKAKNNNAIIWRKSSVKEFSNLWY